MLQRLHLPFEVISPDVDESPTPNETPAGLARRLALGKAQAVTSRLTATDAVVIGADQVLELDGQPLGKPGDLPGARSQLKSLSGHCVTFHSAVSVISSVGEQISVVPCRATFRKLDDQQIERYLALETPFDTAGSAKAEGLGISLLARLQSDDPTAIIGLPLIALTQMLIKAGLDPLNFAQP